MSETLNDKIGLAFKEVGKDIKKTNETIGLMDSRHEDYKTNGKLTLVDCLNYALTIAKTGASQPSTAIDDGSPSGTTTYSSNKIEELINAIKANIGALTSLSTEEKSSVIGAINELKNAIDTNEGKWAGKKQELESTMDSKISAAIAAVVDSAPEDFNTFKEVATWIQNNADAIAAITNRLKVNEVHNLNDTQKGYVWQSIGIGETTVDFVATYTQAKA